ncbi:MAG: alpha-rhamnosidase, partial [Chitinophagaceae bacterium]
MRNLKYSLRSLVFTAGIACLVFIAGCATADSLQLTALTVEGRDTLLGSDILKPRFAWKLQSADRDLRQTAYHLLVSSTREKLDNNEGDIWDTNKTDSDASINIEYNGKPLNSYQSCFWKVKVTTSNGDEVWSKPSYWSVGLLDSTDWKAKWIGLDGFNENDAPDSTFTRLSARYLRNEFPLAKKVESATAFISGMGLYELYINGEKVGNDVLAPTVSEYNKIIYYNTYDVTPLVQEGQNCAAVILGNGRYFGVRNYHGQPDPLTQIPQTHYGLPRLLLQIRVVYNDGSTELISSNEQWKVTDQGAIVANNEFDGEEYDATKELTGWNKTGYNDASWKPVNLMPPAAKQLAAQPNENIRIKEVLKPVKIIKTSRGTHILDMGQNMV